MTVLFGDLYEEMLNLEKAINQMSLEIDNADCDSITKCRLLMELEYIQKQYDDLGNTTFDFEKLNFASIAEAIERCFYCIEFQGDFSDVAPEPYAVASSCGSKKKVRLSLDDLEFFKIWEISDDVKHPDGIEFHKGNFPYTFTTAAAEDIVVTWDSYYGGLNIKSFNKGGNGHAEIAMVQATLTPTAQKKYGVTSIKSCKVLQLTSTKPMQGRPLSNSVDGSKTTWSHFKTNKVVELVFQFYV